MVVLQIQILSLFNRCSPCFGLVLEMASTNVQPKNFASTSSKEDAVFHSPQKKEVLVAEYIERIFEHVETEAYKSEEGRINLSTQHFQLISLITDRFAKLLYRSSQRSNIKHLMQYLFKKSGFVFEMEDKNFIMQPCIKEELSSEHHASEPDRNTYVRNSSESDQFPVRFDDVTVKREPLPPNAIVGSEQCPPNLNIAVVKCEPPLADVVSSSVDLSSNCQSNFPTSHQIHASFDCIVKSEPVETEEQRPIDAIQTVKPDPSSSDVDFNICHTFPKSNGSDQFKGDCRLRLKRSYDEMVEPSSCPSFIEDGSNSNAKKRCYVCTKCDFTFPEERELLNHTCIYGIVLKLKKKSSVIFPYCTLCGRTVKNSGIKSHIRCAVHQHLLNIQTNESDFSGTIDNSTSTFDNDVRRFYCLREILISNGMSVNPLITDKNLENLLEQNKKEIESRIRRVPKRTQDVPENRKCVPQSVNHLKHVFFCLLCNTILRDGYELHINGDLHVSEIKRAFASEAIDCGDCIRYPSDSMEVLSRRHMVVINSFNFYSHIFGKKHRRSLRKFFSKKVTENIALAINPENSISKKNHQYDEHCGGFKAEGGRIRCLLCCATINYVKCTLRSFKKLGISPNIKTE